MRKKWGKGDKWLKGLAMIGKMGKWVQEKLMRQGRAEGDGDEVVRRKRDEVKMEWGVRAEGENTYEAKQVMTGGGRRGGGRLRGKRDWGGGGSEDWGGSEMKVGTGVELEIRDKEEKGG